jgi:4-aminobutyrate aminotransferase
VDFIEEFVLQKFVPHEDLAAMVFEPIQGEGGYVVPPPEYFQRLKKLADKFGILLIDDEVQSGIGRTGKWLAIEHWGIEPDIVCLAKALASGLPLSATVAKAEIMDWTSGAHDSTFGGNPLCCSAAAAVLDVVREEKLLENSKKQGDYILKRLREFGEKSEIVGDVRGKGLMIGVELVEDKDSKKPASEKAADVVNNSWKRGVAAVTCGASTIRLSPPLSIDRALLDAALDILEDVLAEAARNG